MKRLSKILLLLVGLLLLAWGVVIALIATPEVLTPRILDVLQKNTKSEVSLKSVDLSLFTRFPNLTLNIDSLRIAQTKDSIPDLLFAQQCRISISPIALFSKKLQINFASLKNANIYLYVDSLNRPINTFILPEDTQEEEIDTLSEMDLSKYSLDIKRLRIDSARIVIDDRTKRFYTRIENFGVNTSMQLSSKVSDIDIVTGFSNLIVWRDGDLLVKKTAMELESQMILDRDSMQIRFDRARLTVNNIKMKMDGKLNRDTVNSGILVNLNTSLNTPSLTEFLELIPSSIINGKDKITTKGAVAFDMDIKGLYSENSTPTIGATLKITDGKAKYASRKLELEKMDCDAFMFVDMNNPQESYADIKSLHLNTSEILDITMSGKVYNIIDNPRVDGMVKSFIDFNRFSEVFPLNDGIICSGTGDSNIKTQFTLSDIQKSNYANLYIEGETIFKDLNLSFDASKFAQDSSSVAYLDVQAKEGHMLFGDNVISENNSRTLRAKVNLLGMNYKSKSGEYISIKDIELTMGANFDRSKSTMNGIGIRGVAKNTDVGIDSLFSSSLESSDISLVVIPESDARKAMIKATISSQKISANEPNFSSDVRLSTVDMSLSMEKQAPKNWTIVGDVKFSDFGLFTNLFPLEVKIPETSVSLSNKTIRLNNASMSVGSSEFVATGDIHNFMQKLFVDPRVSLSGQLTINAPSLNFSEIMEASNRSFMLLEADSLNQADSLAMDADTSAMFMVPRRMNFVFDLNIDKAKFEDAIIDNVVGRMTLKKGVLSMDKLSLAALGGEAVGSVVYRNIDNSSSNVSADMSLKRVEIDRIGELMPSINTMFPMLKSFSGQVDFDIKANSNINSDSEFDISTLYSAMRFKGKNLVLMDSETFKDLSKTLMFKNKKRNLIDSLEAYALVAESKIDVLPFSMSIDRYTAYIGGSQVVNPETFDVNYKYNVSIIKSPLPFKAGVDITGDLNDFKFKVTKAKLKKTNFKEQKRIYEEYSQSIDESAALLVEELDAKRAALRAKRKAQREAKEAELQSQQAEIEDEIEEVDSLSVQEPISQDSIKVEDIQD